MSSFKSALETLYAEFQGLMDAHDDNEEFTDSVVIPDVFDLDNPKHIELLEKFIEVVEDEWDNEDSRISVGFCLEKEDKCISISKTVEEEYPYSDKMFKRIWVQVKDTAKTAKAPQEEFKGQLAEDEEQSL